MPHRLEPRIGLRNTVTLVILALGGLGASVYGVRSAYARFVSKSSWWDDHLLVALSWFAVTIGLALLVRTVWAFLAPERWFPRWLATTLLVVFALAGMAFWLFMAWAGSLGP